jgi:eukaryotic-like serine/threonine-protein kinase
VRVEALIATDRMTDAKEALRDAKRALDRAAARIGDEAIRASYLNNVPEHARTLALARQYGVE